MKTNLYKCFITRAWECAAPAGKTGFLHPDGVYDDPNGGALRAQLYPRLRHHYQFINEGRSLFSEVDNHATFSINVTGPVNSTPTCYHISTLFHPATVDGCWAHDGRGTVPSIKNDAGDFETRPHRHRLVRIDSKRLALFARLYDENGTPALQARLPVVHSEEVVSVLERFAAQPRRLGDLSDRYFATQHWNETNAQDDGTIRRETRYPRDATEWILQGPHFYVGTPFNKTPNEGCDTNRDYTAIDLTSIPADYLPRTNYVPACNPGTYAERTPKWNGHPVTDFFRCTMRKMVSPTGERTLIPTIIPPGVAHSDGAISIAAEPSTLLGMTALLHSLPFDFFLKSTGRGNIYPSTIDQLPLIDLGQLATPVFARVLLLNSVSPAYSELWKASLSSGEAPVRFANPDRRLHQDFIARGPTLLRTDFERRQALLELDVLAAKALGMTIDELLTIYRIQFPVLQQYERDNLYDQHGRLVPTSVTASGNPCVSLVKLADMLKEQASFDIHREYHPGAPNTEELLRQRIKLQKRDADILQVPERCTVADLMATTEVRWSSPDHPEGRLVPLLGLRYNDPGLEPRKQRVYPTPWTRHSREADYQTAWKCHQPQLAR